MKVALIQDWLTEMGGAEKVFKAIYSLYPEADIFTLVYTPDILKQMGIPESKVRASFIQRLPFAKTKYRNYLPFFMRAIESFDLSEYDLVISSSYCVAKGVLTSAKQVHICYCHSPVRYAWDLYFQYLNNAKLNNGGVKARFVKRILHRLRLWDVSTVNRVDDFISNSNYIAQRIQKVYQRRAFTIYPPVCVSSFDGSRRKDDFYFTCSRLVPYKRIDLIVEAFAKMPDKRLIVIGAGPEMSRIRQLATPNVEIMGYQPFKVLKDYMERARAFVFAAEEDFGIVPVEAQACGVPVIAYGVGGSLETVVNRKTGFFFYRQTPEAIIRAVHEFEKLEDQFDPKRIIEHAWQFSEEAFKRRLREYVALKTDARLKGVSN